MSKILIVDDAPKFRELLTLYLRSDGFDVIEAADGLSAIKLFRSHNPDLVILDVMLPDISGFDVCKKIRETSSVPILFLSALENESYQIVGYHAGADDFLVKPFQPSVFALKVHRMLIRGMQNAAPKQKIIQFSEICLNLDAYTCTVSGESVELTPKEFALLRELMQNLGHVLTREYLLESVWGIDYVGNARAVDTLIKKLRRKLGEKAVLIKTVISVGYKLEDSR